MAATGLTKSRVDRGVKASHSQVNELLARWLGHNTYRSFAVADLASFERAKWAVISAPAVIQRARDIGVGLLKMCAEARSIRSGSPTQPFLWASCDLTRLGCKYGSFAGWSPCPIRPSMH
jgi:hypothetical protein